ncbi:hypothetical protein EJB05_53364, partial [Eragrostis curvula]
MAKVEDAEAKFRDAIDKHQIHPTLELSRKDEFGMVDYVEQISMPRLRKETIGKSSPEIYLKP